MLIHIFGIFFKRQIENIRGTVVRGRKFTIVPTHEILYEIEYAEPLKGQW